MLSGRHALILNFTANTYHWGCYGTAMELYQSLLDRGFYPSTISVHATHRFTPSPATLDQLLDPVFLRHVCEANPVWATAFREADVIVVNGEGTLHRAHAAPRNLLFFMHAARQEFGRPVHLINHSLFPSGAAGGDATNDALYSQVLRHVDHVVPRETMSLRELERLGIPAVQGFDCLPRFINRHQAHVSHDPAFHNTLLLAGGVAVSEAIAPKIARTVARNRPQGVRLVFLSGAKSQPAQDDRLAYEWLKTELPDLEFFEARTMLEWLNALGSAVGLVSGRFHHTLAAATLGTPVVVFPSNTPKVHAVCDMLRLDAPLEYEDPDFEERLAAALMAIFEGRGTRIDAASRRLMLELSERNFSHL